MAWNIYRADITDGDWEDGNWSTGTKPADDGYALVPKEVQNAIAGSDEKGIQVDALWFAKGYRFGVGTSGSPLIIDALKVVHEGDGTLYLKSDDNASAEFTEHVIVNSPNGTLAAHLDGEKMDKITVIAGAVTLASTLGTVALPSRVIVGSVGSPYVANVTVDSGLLAATGTLWQMSGKVTASATVPIVNMLGGEYRQTDGDNMTVYLRGGVFYWNVSDATDGDLMDVAYLFPGSTLDCTEDNITKTITDIYQWPGSVFKRDPDLVTVTNGVTPIGGGGVIQGPGAQQVPGQQPWGGGKGIPV